MNGQSEAPDAHSDSTDSDRKAPMLARNTCIGTGNPGVGKHSSGRHGSISVKKIHLMTMVTCLRDSDPDAREWAPWELPSGVVVQSPSLGGGALQDSKTSLFERLKGVDFNTVRCRQLRGM